MPDEGPVGSLLGRAGRESGRSPRIPDAEDVVLLCDFPGNAELAATPEAFTVVDDVAP